MRQFHLQLAFSAATLLLAPAIAQAQLLGEISFPNSGAEAAQADFVEGVLYLHNFEYEDARDAFLRAQAIDPDFALAYWGEAMTHNHPIWQQQDREAGVAALAKLAPTPDERQAKVASEREAAYLGTLEVLYGTGETAELSKEERDDHYRQAMRRLSERHPEDDEARAFHALSILGSAHEGRAFATYMRAAAFAGQVWDRNDHHPGAAHYLIHSFDDPIHAPLGLPMARTYAKIAPAAAHAQHMTSHIFVALGLWQDVVDANIVARRVQNDGFAERGRPPRLCGHYPYWLEYGYLQLGRFDDARQVLAACVASLEDGGEEREPWHLGAMRARYLIDSGRWSEADELMPTSEAVDTSSANFTFIDGLRAHEAGDLEGVWRAVTALREIDEGFEAEEAEILALELEGLHLLTSDPEAAIETLTRAAEAEAALPYMFGPPAIVKPTAELLAEVLVDLGRAEAALEVFRQQLERTPGRVAARLGLARAAGETGRIALAREIYGSLVAQSKAAEATPEWLGEARAGLTER